MPIDAETHHLPAAFIHGFGSVAAPPAEAGCPSRVQDIPSPGQLGPRPLRFARLDRLSQLALAAAHLCWTRCGEPAGDGAGLALGTAEGSHHCNEAFRATLAKVASPALFAVTLASAAAGQITIALQLRGPALTFASGAGAGLSALAAGAQMLADGRARFMLCGAADVLAPTLEAAYRDEPLREGAAFVGLSAEARGARARIAGTGMCRGPGALERAVARALGEAGLSAAALSPVAAPGPLAPEALLMLGELLQGPLPRVLAAGDPEGGVTAICIEEPAWRHV